jgi:hypothetical protein
MNANDELKEHTSSEHYHSYMCGMLLTDGALAMCEKFSCFWFADVICSYQHKLKNEEFQVWSLGKNEDSSAIVLCTDGNDRVLISQDIPWTDFKADVATLWVEGNVILLPSEH